jgi:hypothetical protein
VLIAAPLSVREHGFSLHAATRAGAGSNEGEPLTTLAVSLTMLRAPPCTELSTRTRRVPLDLGGVVLVGLALSGCCAPTVASETAAADGRPHRHAEHTVSGGAVSASPSTLEASAPEASPKGADTSMAACAGGASVAPNAGYASKGATGDGCAAAAGSWLGAEGPPARDWWQPFAKPPPEERDRATHVAAARVSVKVAHHQATSRAARAHRSFAGGYRWCYERALAIDEGVRSGSGDGALAGHWVARIAYGEADRVCAIDVIDTNLPSALSECLQGVVPRLQGVTGTAGQLELVLAFAPR